ncbi:MAG: NAD(P)(+) transhydrogenase (Re/Si-specific) subunit beta, partial [Candidatus Marinimicrobia bacterium]|nr:NAD(P)(+) transhydrogenase (Re/Si-specific) subunit beta [Candidatus Neomarinimicrobiota bacterium]
MSQAVVNLVYLIAAVLFIFALTGLSHPRTAVRGNLLGAFGMLIAIVVTLLDKRIVSFEVIVAGLAVGAIIGALMAYRSPMTAIPQVVAVFNGLGGGASALAAGAALEEALRGNLLEALATQTTVAAGASALIGGVAFTGSMIAFAKLRGLITEKPVLLPGRHILNIVLFLACLGLGAWLVIDASSSLSFWILVGVA